MSKEITPVKIPGVKGNVSVQGADGIFYKVLHNDEPLKPTKGRWVLPLKKGGEGTLKSAGMIPGFHTLTFDGKDVLSMGKASIAERVVIFLPLILVLFGWVGMIGAVALVFANILVVKNTDFPAPVRIALPIVNTLALGVILGILSWLVTGQAS